MTTNVYFYMLRLISYCQMLKVRQVHCKSNSTWRLPNRTYSKSTNTAWNKDQRLQHLKQYSKQHTSMEHTNLRVIDWLTAAAAALSHALHHAHDRVASDTNADNTGNWKKSPLFATNGSIVQSFPLHFYVIVRPTLCLKKVPTFKLTVTISNLNRFSNFLHCWKAYEICYKTHTTLPTSP